MNKQSETIEITYNELLETASEKVKRQLAILKDACESQVTGKSSDFSIATIGKISEGKGGVKTQTIRNSTKNAKAYRSLIEVYSAYYSAPIGKQLSVKNDLMQMVKNTVEDPQARILIMEALAQNKKLKRELNIFKSGTTLELDFRENAQRDAPEPLQLTHERLTDGERKALVHFLSDTHLKDLGWSRGASGRLVDANGKPTTKPFFVEAIEKLSLVFEE